MCPFHVKSANTQSQLKDEMEMNMRLIGCSDVSQLHPNLIDTRGLGFHTSLVPGDTLSHATYDPLSIPQEMARIEEKAKL